jgi:hypothetical protein
VHVIASFLLLIIISSFVFGFGARVCVLLALQMVLVLLSHVDNEQHELLT